MYQIHVSTSYEPSESLTTFLVVVAIVVIPTIILTALSNYKDKKGTK